VQLGDLVAQLAFGIRLTFVFFRDLLERRALLALVDRMTFETVVTLATAFAAFSSTALAGEEASRAADSNNTTGAKSACFTVGSFSLASGIFRKLSRSACRIRPQYS